MNRIPLTVTGAEKLQTELSELKTTKRPRVIQAIAEAREHGDLKENAEYHAAREEQSFIEGRIADIESKLAKAEIIDITRLEKSSKVVFGTTVTLANEETGEKTSYQIVGEDEANVDQGRISVGSPIARAMIGKEKGDIASVKAPGGIQEYEILAVKYI